MSFIKDDGIRNTGCSKQCAKKLAKDQILKTTSCKRLVLQLLMSLGIVVLCEGIHVGGKTTEDPFKLRYELILRHPSNNKLQSIGTFDDIARYYEI